MHSAKYYTTFIEKNFSVVDKYGATVPFKLNAIQKRIIGELTGNDIILKARRHGITTLIAAIYTVDFIMTQNFRAVLVSHETKATQRILDKVVFFLDSMKRNLPEMVNSEQYVKLKYASRNELVNEVQNSSFYIGTAGSKTFGRGDQISALHLSEAAYYEFLDKFLIGVLPAVMGGMVSIESTANGYNEFRDLWRRNKESPRPFATHFIPWFENPEYMLACPPTWIPTKDEEELGSKYGLNNNQLCWRRYELDRMNGDIDAFAQEYPSNDEEAFIVSGNHVWSPTILRYYMNMTKKPVVTGNLYGANPVQFEENDHGYVQIFKAPVSSHYYVIGADVAGGGSRGDERDADFSCGQVIDQTTYEQVACWHGRIDPDLFGRQLDMLGQYYNNALLAVERNSIGITTLMMLRDLYYSNLYYQEQFGFQTTKMTDNLGWVTDRMTKDLIVNTATQLFREHRVRLYDTETIGEMMGFVRSSTGLALAASGYHDDRVMALLIALKMLGQPQAETRGNPIEMDLEDDGMSGGMIFGRNGEEIMTNDILGEGELI